VIITIVIEEVSKYRMKRLLSTKI